MVVADLRKERVLALEVHALSTKASDYVHKVCLTNLRLEKINGHLGDNKSLQRCAMSSI